MPVTTNSFYDGKRNYYTTELNEDEQDTSLDIDDSFIQDDLFGKQGGKTEDPDLHKFWPNETEVNIEEASLVKMESGKMEGFNHSFDIMPNMTKSVSGSLTGKNNVKKSGKKGKAAKGNTSKTVKTGRQAKKYQKSKKNKYDEYKSKDGKSEED